MASAHDLRGFPDGIITSYVSCVDNVISSLHAKFVRLGTRKCGIFVRLSTFEKMLLLEPGNFFFWWWRGLWEADRFVGR